jgi:hypothetical protein
LISDGYAAMISNYFIARPKAKAQVENNTCDIYHQKAMRKTESLI